MRSARPNFRATPYVSLFVIGKRRINRQGNVMGLKLNPYKKFDFVFYSGIDKRQIRKLVTLPFQFDKKRGTARTIRG